MSFDDLSKEQLKYIKGKTESYRESSMDDEDQITRSEIYLGLLMNNQENEYHEQVIESEDLPTSSLNFLAILKNLFTKSEE
jgi:hypothetical protein